MGKVTVEQLATRRHRRDWLDVPRRVLSGAPGWVQPLDILERRRISPRSAAFFSFAEAAFFIAYVDGAPVGRISAQVNRRHLERYDDATGHFGFFDCIDDAAVSAALFDSARSWLAARGMKRVVGPFNLSVNEEIGLLVDGFDLPPAILMPHGAAWYPALVEAAGFEKATDVLAYRFRPGAGLPPAMQRAAAKARTMPGVTVRPFRMKQVDREAELMIGIFNDAWSRNWSFVPFSQAEIDSLIAEIKSIMRDRWCHFVMVDGREVGFIIALPDVNRVLTPSSGGLLPFTWFHLLRRVLRNDWQSCRIPLFGLRREFHRLTVAPYLFALLFEELLSEGVNYPLDWVEFSWVLEDNRGMRQIAELYAGPPAKRYRLYARDTR